MFRKLENRLKHLQGVSLPVPLASGLKGIEKESLRVNSDGSIAQTLHPAQLGSALTNRYITTDYSEALLEFVTPPFSNAWETVQFLCDIHQFTYGNIGDELLWVTSMPCTVTGEDSVPVARYGSSNVGQMKHIYRIGLGHRYGRVMQTIAGIHFNYSVPVEMWPVYLQAECSEEDLSDFKTAAYFGLARNFRRYGWLILYLFGASPAICKSFLGGNKNRLDELDAGTLHFPYATSLRMSELGYKNRNQSAIKISLNSMDDYIADLTNAIRTSVPAYEEIGTLVDGEYRQLSPGFLQIENEYYGMVRPKRVARSGESPTHALSRGGVEYVEIRALDLNVFDPIGMSQGQICFMEAFLLFCLLNESEPLGDKEIEELDWNHSVVAESGRRPGLNLQWTGRNHKLTDVGRDILTAMCGICELLDGGGDNGPYVSALEDQRAALDDSDRTPSARILQELRVEKESFFAFAMRMAETHRDYFKALVPISEQRLAEFDNEARESVARQAAIEDADSISFEEYLSRYYAQTG